MYPSPKDKKETFKIIFSNWNNWGMLLFGYWLTDFGRFQGLKVLAFKNQLSKQLKREQKKVLTWHTREHCVQSSPPSFHGSRNTWRERNRGCCTSPGHRRPCRWWASTRRWRPSGWGRGPRTRILSLESRKWSSACPQVFHLDWLKGREKQ